MPNNEPIHIAPNKPVYLALVDPEGDSANFDFELRLGRYQTTTGELIVLPRPAVVKLNELGPRSGEEIQITKIWSGKAGDMPEWSICFSTRSENARAREEMEPQDLTATLQASIEQVKAGKSNTATPTPIREVQKKGKPVEQPRLFDRGTGTHGPAPRPEPANDPRLSMPIPAAPPMRTKPSQIPANVAVREILHFINLDPNTKNWSDQARQDMASTVYIAHVKQGHIGLWERGE
jgi:hypothetical protein